MDWHYACLISRLPIFTLGIIYFIHEGKLMNMLGPVTIFLAFHELSVANSLIFLTSNFYAPFLIVGACVIFNQVQNTRILSLIGSIGSKSLEIFMGNGVATFILHNMEISLLYRLFCYIFLNIVFILVFVMISKILPSNR